MICRVVVKSLIALGARVEILLLTLQWKTLGVTLVRECIEKLISIG